ncbi:hypothetical protein NLI96_g6979 [Meripilus lineatus]|uniref:Uncharacterized protein n=1 Tax=Meripilus lineatus TaxID=2056292 RepID=A0AAD5YCG4_9APHY|nr:hypothetical protein NLI96_g6979 [Physisporinus lineatus]
MPLIDVLVRQVLETANSTNGSAGLDNGCEGVAVNPDISGIGVRLSFYLQNLFLVLLVTRSWEDAPGALWTFVTTSFGLTVAAVIQAKNHELSFFQALQVSNLVWMANFGSYLALASYSRHRANHEENKKMSKSSKNANTETAQKTRSDDSVKFAAMLQMFFSIALTFYTWKNASTLGNQDQCTPTVKYVIFVALPALHSGRVVALTITGILTAGYAFITAHELLSYFKKKKSPTKPDADVEQQLVVPEIKVEDHSALSPTGSEDVIPSFPSPSLALTPLTSRTRSVASSQGQEDEDSPDRTRNRRIHLRDPRKPKRQRRQEWSPDLDPMLLGITIFQIIVFVYFVTMTELLLKRNPAADSSQDSDWGFGQY